MSHLRFILNFLLLLVTLSSAAQYYETGEDPASIRWKEIKTEHFNVIYPEKYGSLGLEYARSLEKASSKLTSLYPGKRIRIPVVIHNYSVHSNAYVAWAPRRMEIFPTPEQNNIPLNPFDQLSIHELTHVNQMVSLNTGFSKAASYLFGEQFTGIDAALLPLWYLEGDAVFAESALTESGRGRIPAFQKELKAIIAEKGEMFKYDKIVNSSYRDYVPNHYQSGFQITTWARAKYGNGVWNKALKKTGAEPFTVNPVNISLRESTGHRKKSLFTEAFDTLKTIWAAEAVNAAEGSKKNYQTVNPDKKGRYINYYSPVYAGTDSILAVKTSLSSPPSFVLIDPLSKTEKKIHAPGIINPFIISYGGDKLVWVELQYDMRWNNREYSVVKIMDLRTGTVSRLSKRSRYLAASISPDGKTISAIENSIDNKTRLVLIDPGTGEIRQAIPSPDNSYLQRPQWASGGDRLTLISLTDEGEGIVSYTPATGIWKTLIQPGREDLQSTFLRNDSLYFISSESGTENLMLLSPDGKVSSVTNSKFGATDFCINSQRIVFSDYSASGNNIGFALLNDNPPVTLKNDSASFLINRFDLQTKTGDTSINTSYIPGPYKKWQHLFRFHSWMPFYADLDEITSDPASIRPGLTLMTQNTLSTLISTIGYEYSEDKKNLLHTKIIWKGWYPVFETEVDYGDDPLIYKPQGNAFPYIGDPSEIRKGISLINTVSVPLRFSNGRFFQYLRPSYSWEYSNDYIYVNGDLAYDYGQSVNTARIYFSNYYRYAYRDINPRWAQTFDVSYTSAPWDKDIYGTSLTFRSSLYFPGFFPNHSIRLKYENENQDPSKFIYGNKVPLPRGYKDIRSLERELISADYTMPLLYPDLNLASLIYVTRIRTSLFYDFSASDGNTYYNLPAPPYQEYRNYEEIFRSYGFELLADFHLFRLPFEISGGIQTAWTEANDKPVLKFLLNIDLFGMNIGRDQGRPF